MALPRIRNLSIYQQASRSQPAGFCPPAGLAVVELMIGGRGWIREGADWLPVVAGDLLWHQDGDWTVQRSDEADPYRCLALSVLLDGDAPRLLPRVTRWDDTAAARDFAREARAWSHDPGVDLDALSAAVVGRLVVEGRRFLARQRESGLPEPLRRAQVHLEARFAQDCSIGALAAVAGCSVQHLHHLFRHHLGITPHQWVLQRRLREAKDRLVGTQEELAVIAAACGFADAAALCRTFRRATGTSPGVWRHRRW